MKKKIVIYMNCHGNYIKKWLEKSKITDIYDIIWIYNVEVINNNNKLTEKHKEILMEGDILILQYIKNDRGELNHEYIKENISKKDAIIFLIPHYTYSGYFYNDIINEKILKNRNISKKEIIDIINNTIFNENDVLNFNDRELKNIGELDKLSSVKMETFVRKEYKKYRLFSNRGHPLNYFFYEMVNQLLSLLKFDILDINFNNDGWHKHQMCPIFDQTRRILGLEFDTNIYGNCGTFISNYEYYYIIMYNTLNINLPDNIISNIERKYFNTSTFLHFITGDKLTQTLSIIRNNTTFPS